MHGDFLEKSKEYIQEGKFEKAQIILRRALNDNPNHAKALELSGDLALKMGRADEAVQRYEHASNNYTNTNQYAEAIVCLEKIVKIDKTNDEIFSRLADLYRFFGLPNSAIKTILDLCSWAMDNKDDAIFVSGLRKIVEFQPKSLALRLSFAKLLLAIGRKQEAEDELKKLKSLAGDAKDGDILNEVNKLLPQLDGGEELDPKSRIELGNLLYEIGSKDEAIIEFEKAVSDLLESDETEEAINVLNRIIEIDPNNTEAVNKINELKGAGEVKAEIEEEVPEAEIGEKVEEEVETPQSEVVETAPTEEGMETFQDLSKEIEGFIAATEFDAKEEPPAAEAQEEMAETPPVEAAKAPSEETPSLEGQIADIEFLLKEAEAPTTLSFEVANEFDNFRNNIVWQDEGAKKKLDLAKMAFDAGLYETAVNYVKDIKDNEETWPLSLEINGASLVKLGRYTEARKTIAPSLLLEEISEKQKIELRYLLASAYEGLGDFDNAMREIERIITINPNYKDVKEIYVLMGGKALVQEEPEKVIKERPIIREEMPSPEPTPPPIKPAPVEIKEMPSAEEMYPTIIEEMPREEKTSKKLQEEIPDAEERKDENIAFL